MSNTLAVVGSGFMGQGIARAALHAGFTTVVLHDPDAAALARARANVTGALDGAGAGAPPHVRVATARDLAEAVREADFVIEAAPEVMEVKREIFRVVGRAAPPRCVFATNTSTMSIDEIAASSEAKDRVLGMHFFVPEESRLVELTRGSRTSDEALREALEVAHRLPCKNGSRLTVVLDRWSPGFVVNRSTAPVVAYLSWILDRAAARGVTPQRLDEAAGLVPGFFRTMDFVGLDVVHRTCLSFAETLSPDLGPGRVLSERVRDGKLGRKTGEGLYRYGDGEPLRDAGGPQALEAGLGIDVELLMALQFNECCRIVEEGVLPDFRYIDEYLLAALGRPGPCAAGFELHRRWCALLQDLSRTAGRPYFAPCALMRAGDFDRRRGERT